MQARYYDLLSSVGSNAPPVATSADLARLQHLENQMGDPRSDYWRDPSMQSEYRSILSLVAPETEGN
jgi:hypothetical protein